MFEHHDVLEELNKHFPLRDKLNVTHKSVCEIFPFIICIAIVLYDSEMKILKTFLHSSKDEHPLDHYHVHIDNTPSLKEILNKKLPRIINYSVTFEQNEREHTKRIGRHGYASSYTLPMFNDGEFIGFIFFNSNEVEVFTESVLRQIDIYGHMITLMVNKELIFAQTLLAAIKTTGKITHVRDPEMGSHIYRMSRYSRIIVTELADKYGLDDTYIEHVFMFSHLHDIGKIGLPDNILLKPGKLDEDEMALMKSHTLKGGEIIDDLLSNFGLNNFEYTDVLHNIAVCHHEAVDGSGYPAGLKGDAIPLEARIVAVADVFDALTSKRSYKEIWSNEEAILKLKQLSGETLDQDCVNALLKNIEEVEKIQIQFNENDYG